MCRSIRFDRRFDVGCLLTVLVMSLGACSSGKTGKDVFHDADVATDSGAAEAIVFPEVRTSDLQDGGGTDGPVLDTHGEIPGPACAPGEGCFLDKCTENKQCQSGWCVEHLGEGVCSQVCQDECPDGWSCKQVAGTDPDVVFICVSKFANLCRPCSSGADCKSVGGMDDVCVDYGSDGDFCGGACEENDDCPWGFSCKDGKTVEGAGAKQCVADTGTCPCTAKSVALAATTSCEVENEYGKCSGTRLCAAEGLTICSALQPAQETCDGIDDDCDGDVDEPALEQGKLIELCDDDNDCTEDSCTGDEGCKNAVLESGSCDDDNPCSVADHCVQGTCVGTPVDCDDQDPCTDNICTETGGCEFPPNNDPCDDENPCTLADQCADGKCQGTSMPCECQVDGDCGVLEDGDLCNGTLVCDTGTLPYKCVVDPATAVVCPEPDGENAFCLQGACDPGTGECTFVPNHEGFLCDNGNACTVNDKCTAGACAGGVAVNCSDGSPCTDDSCAPESGCSHEPSTAPCTDGDACTVGDHCAEGLCLAGEKDDCDDGNPCTSDTCDAVAGCVYSLVDGACDDGDACTTGDHCAQGKCIPLDVTECGDGNPCTDDSCTPESGCVYALNAAPCDDGNTCTTGDKCSKGLCKGVGTICNDNNPCTDDSCGPDGGCLFVPNSMPCEDGNACTTGDQCVGGACSGTGMIDCDDGEGCTKDWCLPVGGCQHMALDVACTDSNACTQGDQCAAGKCVPGQPVQCDDGNPCTLDLCDVIAGCAHAAVGGACDDGNPCTLSDACMDGKCVAGAMFDCDDGNPCTQDQCDPSGKCQHNPVLGLCNDGNACTSGDTCQAGKCVGTGVDCDDGNPCTDDLCNNPAIGCYHTLNTAPCNDGNQCTTGDVCAKGICAGLAVGCDDGNVCTTDTCVPAAGCKHSSNLLPCDDNNKCTTSDACSGGKCMGGPALSCNDGNVCTTDGCDPVKGCTYSANALFCDDGNKCTENDKCSVGKCTGTAVKCNDGNECTADACAGALGCQYSPVQNGVGCGGKPGWTCVGGKCGCTPVCEGKTCGPDGCGSVCGLCANGSSCNGQGKCVPYVVWSGAYGNEWSTSNYAGGLAVDSASNVYLVGEFFGGPIDLGGGPLKNSGGRDVCVLKVTGDGTHVWSRSFGSSKYDYVRGVAADGQGNSYVTGGYTGAGTIDFGGAKITNNDFGWNNTYLAKLDPGGEFVWAKGFGGTSNMATSIAMDPAGNVLIAGGYFGNTDFGGGPLPFNGPQQDFFLAQFSSAGGFQRAYGFGSEGNDAATSVVVDVTGNIYLMGIFGGATLDLGGNVITNAAAGKHDGFIAKFDPQMNLLWSKAFGGTGYEFPDKIAVTSDGDIVLVGTFSSKTLSFGPYELTNTSSGDYEDCFVVRLDSEGHYEWARQYGGPGSDACEDVAVDASGNAYLAGSLSAFQMDLGGGPLANSGVFSLKLDPQGAHLWSAAFGGGGLHVRINLGLQGEVFLGGSFGSGLVFGDKLLVAPGADSRGMFLARLAE